MTGGLSCAEFLDMHPGGAQRLMLAAGGAIDPFWAMYAQHNTAEVHRMLEGYRIGTLVCAAPYIWDVITLMCRLTARQLRAPHDIATGCAGRCRRDTAGREPLCK